MWSPCDDAYALDLAGGSMPFTWRRKQRRVEGSLTQELPPVHQFPSSVAVLHSHLMLYTPSGFISIPSAITAEHTSQSGGEMQQWISGMHDGDTLHVTSGEVFLSNAITVTSSITIQGASSRHQSELARHSLKRRLLASEPELTTLTCTSTFASTLLFAPATAYVNFIFQNCSMGAVDIVPFNPSPLQKFIFHNCVFRNNLVTDYSSIKYVDVNPSDPAYQTASFIGLDRIPVGAGIAVRNGGSLPQAVELVNCNFTNNHAWNGSAVYSMGLANITAENCIFSNNTSEESTLYMFFSCLHLFDSVVGWNSARRLTAGIRVEQPVCALVEGAGDPALKDYDKYAFYQNTVFEENTVRIDNTGVAVSTYVVVFNGQKFLNATFRRNRQLNDAAGYGGGIGFNVCFGSVGADPNDKIWAAIVVKNSTFDGNKATYGAGLYVDRCHVTRVLDTNFTNNHAIKYGGGFQGGIGVTILERNRFNNNTSERYGGAVHVGGDIVAVLTNNNTFDGNTALFGGALSNVDVQMYHSVYDVYRNNKALQGGAVLTKRWKQHSGFVASTFENNMATKRSGAVDDFSEGVGGAVLAELADCRRESYLYDYYHGCSLLLHHDKFTGNHAHDGGAVFVRDECTGADGTECGVVEVLDSNFTQNSVSRGGGAAIMWGSSIHYLNIICNMSYDTNPGPYLDMPYPDPGAIPFAERNYMPCFWWKDNILYDNAYGPIIATTAPYTLKLTDTNESVHNYRSNSYLPVKVAIQDFFNQTIKRSTLPITARCYDVPDAMVGITTVQAKEGISRFENIAVRGVPGNYNVAFEASVLINKSRALVHFNVRKCLIGEVTNRRGDDCTLCNGRNEFSFNPTNKSCDNCPEGGHCNSKHGFVIVPKNGYWHSSPKSTQFHQCELQGSCTGLKHETEDEREDRLEELSMLAQTNNDSTAKQKYMRAQCGVGYLGRLCKQCDGPMYGRSDQSGTCAKCASKAQHAFVYLLGILAVVVLATFTIMGQMKTLDDAFTQASRGRARRNSITTLQAEGDYTSSTINKIMMSYLQIILIAMKARLKWSFSVNGLKNFLSNIGAFVGLSGSLDCALNHGTSVPVTVQQAIVTVATPVLLIAASLVLWILFYFRSSSMIHLNTIISGIHRASTIFRGSVLRRRTADPEQSHAEASSSTTLQEFPTPLIGHQTVENNSFTSHNAWNWARFRSYLKPRITITVISIIFLLYPNTTQALLTIFSCVKLDNSVPGRPYYAFREATGMYWSPDLDLDCYSGSHLTLVLVVGLPGVLILSLGVPLFFATFLTHNRHMLHEKKFKDRYGFLYRDYKPSHFYWESVIMLRKLAMVMASVFLESYGVQIQILTEIALMLAFLVAQGLCAPFAVPKCEMLERIAITSILFVLTISAFFFVELPEAGYQLLSSALVIQVVLIAATFIYQFVFELLKNTRNQIGSMLRHSTFMDHPESLPRKELRGIILKNNGRFGLFLLYFAVLLKVLPAEGTSNRVAAAHKSST